MNNEFENGENEETKVIEVQAEPQKQPTTVKYGNPLILFPIVAAYLLMFFGGFMAAVIENLNALQVISIIVYILTFACIALAFTFILMGFRKNGKSIFSLETVLALLALIIFFV